MKKIVSATALALTLWATGAQAAFVDAYSIDHWQKTHNGGHVNLKNAPNSINISSNDVKNTSLTAQRDFDFTMTAVKSALIIFDWSYTTNDKRGAGFDPFGIVLNGIFHQLSNNSGSSKDVQSGTYSFVVHVGDIFGFRASSFDSIKGASTTTISNFHTPSQVPVPAALWLMAIPMLGLAGKKRKTLAA